jgi:hypothetical protein
VKRIGTVEDDALVGALKEEWREAKAARETAEQRVAQIEGIERDLAADKAEVEALVETWESWSATLAQTQGAADGSVPAEAQAQARQILKKVLVGTIEVTPAEGLLVKFDDPDQTRDGWVFQGYSRFENVLSGGLGHGLYNALPNYPTMDALRADPANQPPRDGSVISDEDLARQRYFRPIAGGSNAGDSAVCDTDRAPIPPTLVTPRRSRGAPR